MLFIGGIAAYTFVWDLGDVGIGLMTIFNVVFLYLLADEAIDELKDYEKSKKLKKPIETNCNNHEKNHKYNKNYRTATNMFIY